MNGSLCNVTGTWSASVRTVERHTDRLVGDEDHCATLKLGIRVRVMDDYLLVARGSPELVNLDELARRLSGVRGGFQNRLSAIRRAVADLGGLVLAKRMYRCGGVPCIPGSTLKGAVRSRIELGALGRQGNGKVLADMLYDRGPLQALPPKSRHGWRHARIWCESVFEARVREQWGASVLEDLMGTAQREYFSLGSRVYFPDAKAVGERGYSTALLMLENDELVEAVSRNTVFEGELVLNNVSLEDLGVILYGLGLDKKYSCGGKAGLLVGAFKYRARQVKGIFDEFRKKWVPRNAKVCFGAVEVSLTSISYAPWSRCRWGDEVDEVAKKALNRARRAYPELRFCFDEVGRRDQLSGCIRR